MSIRVRLLASFAMIALGAVATLFAGSFVADEIDAAQRAVTENALPQSVAAQGLVSQTNEAADAIIAMDRASGLAVARAVDQRAEEVWRDIGGSVDRLAAQRIAPVRIEALRGALDALRAAFEDFASVHERRWAARERLDAAEARMAADMREFADVIESVHATSKSQVADGVSGLYDMVGFDEEAIFEHLDNLLDLSLANAERMGELKVQSLEIPQAIARMDQAGTAAEAATIAEEISARLQSMARDVRSVDDPHRREQLKALLADVGAALEGGKGDSLLEHTAAILAMDADLARDRHALDALANDLREATASIFDDSGAFIENAMTEVGEVMDWGRETFAIAAAATLAIVVLVALLVVERNILRRLRLLVQATRELSAGNVDFVIVDRRSDELGAVAAALRDFKVKLADNKKLREERDDVAAEFERNVDGVARAVASAASTILENAGELARLSEANDREAAQAAMASTRSTQHVNSVASAASQAAAANDEIAERIEEAARLAVSTTEIARSSNQRVEVLDRAAKTIGAATELIDDIADQTNLLALNATIEAARAGDAGRGFAVVAQQVKALAAQTTNATAEIAELVRDMQSASTDAVGELAKNVELMSQIGEVVSAVAASSNQQNAVIADISQRAGAAAAASGEASCDLVGLKNSAERAEKASAEVLAAVGGLAAQSEGLQSAVMAFMKKVRAA